RGPTKIELAAPGDNILTATLGGGYAFRSGTSYAAPHVAGVAALMAQANPTLGGQQAKSLLTTWAATLKALDGSVAGSRRLASVQSVQASRFSDIPMSVFADDVMWADAEDVTRGCGPALFCPDGSLTRAQMASFLVRALDLPPAGASPFTDTTGSVHEPDIATIAQAGITTGCTPTRYCPDEPVTRAQMASFLVRALDLPPAGASPFTDTTGSVHEPDIATIAQAGITTGCAPALFCPEQTITRGQAVAMIRRSG
ncbi:MAG: S-layer homology domain-containing protein, partial [Acidimicrobiia bacterium]|nr:S-layer homology domain-containing protein [Acidimicrobiia bacterium]